MFKKLSGYSLATAVALSASAQSLTNLGTLPGIDGSTAAYAVSPDGTAVAGISNTDSGSVAIRWTQEDGLISLGKFPGGTYSNAAGISNGGSVVVGSGDTASGERAFRWTSAGGMTNLGVLPGGNSSTAQGVSADGSVVVGYSYIGFITKSFRWTAGGGMTDLGFMTNGNYALAMGVSADGSAVAGYGDVNYDQRAFRWTAETGMVSLGVMAGGSYSTGFAISGDGLTVVGSGDVSGSARAFRWNAATGMVSLGVIPGGSYSHARGVSSDGSVVVGFAGDDSTGLQRAFRWTLADGMVDLGALPGGSNSNAYGVSDDGSVVVGWSDSANGQRAFLWRERVMLDVQDWLNSVGGVYSMLSTSLELSRLHLDGAHHRPLAELGRGKSYWATGDIAGSSRSRDLITRSGEAGITFEPWNNVLFGVGAGYGRQDQQLLNDGSATTFGQYLIGEIDFLLADGGILSVLVSSGDWENETDRGYVTGGGVDYSHGETDIKSTSFRLRYDSPILVKTLGADVKAYASYGQSRARSDGYVETGGSYAGSFDRMEQTAKEGRFGVAATRTLGEMFRGRLSAEWIRRFDRNQAALTATDVTSTLDLTLPGAPVVRDQARVGFDLDYLMDAKTTLSFTIHAAGRGEVADVSGAVSLRKGF